MNTSELSEQNAFSRDNFLAFFKEQNSTIFLQRFIMGANKEIIDFILLALKDNFRSIIKHKNGNYFCSDLFKVCEQKQRIQILKEIYLLI